METINQPQRETMMATTDTTSALKAFASEPLAGETIQMSESRVTVRVLAHPDQTDGVSGWLDSVYPVGTGFPMHVHHKEAETIYVLEGTLLYISGDMRIEAKPGTLLYSPREVAHGYRAIGDSPVRFIECFVPGLAELFTNPEEFAGYLAAGHTSPKYDLELVGGMPE